MSPQSPSQLIPKSAKLRLRPKHRESTSSRASSQFSDQTDDGLPNIKTPNSAHLRGWVWPNARGIDEACDLPPIKSCHLLSPPFTPDMDEERHESRLSSLLPHHSIKGTHSVKGAAFFGREPGAMHRRPPKAADIDHPPPVFVQRVVWTAILVGNVVLAPFKGSVIASKWLARLRGSGGDCSSPSFESGVLCAGLYLLIAYLGVVQFLGGSEAAAAAATTVAATAAAAASRDATALGLLDPSKPLPPSALEARQSWEVQVHELAHGGVPSARGVFEAAFGYAAPEPLFGEALDELQTAAEARFRAVVVAEMERVSAARATFEPIYSPLAAQLASTLHLASICTPEAIRRRNEATALDQVLLDDALAEHKQAMLDIGLSIVNLGLVADALASARGAGSALSIDHHLGSLD